MAPIVHGLEAEYGDKMNFIYLDIDDPANSDYKKALNYRYQPHLMLLDADGDILVQWVGFVGEDDLRNEIEKALSN